MPTTLAAAGVKTLPDVSIGHSLIQMVLALLVIVVCIWGLGKILTRMRSGGIRSGNGPAKRRAAGDGLSIVSRQTLGKDLSIATVRWGEREVLVGIAGSTITFLNDARAEGAAPTQQPAGTAFAGAQAFPAFPAQAPAAFPGADAFASSLQGQTSGDSVSAASRPASLIDTLRNATLRR
jgi:flagellar biogenesis protein FliO